MEDLLLCLPSAPVLLGGRERRGETGEGRGGAGRDEESREGEGEETE